MWLADCNEDKGNPSTADRSHQLALTFPHSTHYQMTIIFQQPIIRAPVFTEDDRRPVIKITTSWLLGNIHQWDGRVHTPMLGFGHYPLTYEVIPLFVSFWWKHWQRIDRSPGIPSMGSKRRENQMTRPSFTISGGGMCTRTSSLIADCRQTWSEERSGFDALIGLRSMTWFFLTCSKWGSWTGLVPTTIFTKQLRLFNTQPQCISKPFPVL